VGLLDKKKLQNWMMNKNTSAQAYGAVLATIFASLVTCVVHDIWPGLHFSLILIMFITLWVGFLITGIWIIRYRSDELNRKLPISGTEHRRRKREFYEWLRRSQGPR
jgi:hypothetical protein